MLYQLYLEDTSAKQNKASVIDICMITGASSMNSLFLSLPPKLYFQGKASVSITPLIYHLDLLKP